MLQTLLYSAVDREALLAEQGLRQTPRLRRFRGALTILRFHRLDLRQSPHVPLFVRKLRAQKRLHQILRQRTPITREPSTSTLMSSCSTP